MIVLQESLFVGNFLLKAVVDMTIQWEKVTMSGHAIRVACLTCRFFFCFPRKSAPQPGNHDVVLKKSDDQNHGLSVS